MSRVARIIGVDYPHHVIQRGNNRQTIFFDDQDRIVYLNFLRKYHQECHCVIHAYCLMTNHVHLLLTPKQEEAMSKFMQKVSLCYTQYVNKKYKRTGRLWECRYYSSLIEKEAYLWAVCKYIERNSVRAKIVHRPEEYQWSSISQRCLLSKKNIIQRIWSSDYEHEEYMRYLNEPEKEPLIGQIRKSILKGMPTGSEDFMTQISRVLGLRISHRPRGRPWKKLMG